MKTPYYFLIILMLVKSSLFSQSNNISAMETWSNLLEKPELVEFFDGMFEDLGVRITETDETFTVHHLGNRFFLTPNIIEDRVDFVVEIKLDNVQNMISHAFDNVIDLSEAHRIVSVLFTPLTKETLKNPVMTRRFLRWISGVENLIHVYLLMPNGSNANKHTLIYVNKFFRGEWVVLKGTHGIAKRVYRINVDEAVEYQKEVFSALNRDSISGWWKFGTWYRKWRKSVSE